MSYVTPDAAGRYPGYAGTMRRQRGYMYSGTPGSDAARAPFYAGVGPGTSPGAATFSGHAGPGDVAAVFRPPGAATQPGAAANPQSTASALYDPTTDPILQRIKALGTRNIGDAVAGGDALRKQLLIQYGDPNLARHAQFGDLNSGITGDENTALAAQQNPFSTLALLGQTHQRQDASLDDAANKAGLYYSSTHANELGDENNNYLRQQTDANSQLQQQLAGITGQLLAAHQTADSSNVDALGTATQNFINAAIQSGYDFGGYDAAGNPILTKTGTAAANAAPTPADPTAPVSSGGAAQQGSLVAPQALSGFNPAAATANAANNIGPLAPLDAAAGYGGDQAGQIAAGLSPIAAALRRQQLNTGQFVA